MERHHNEPRRRLALAQCAPVLGDFQANLKLHIELAEAAAAEAQTKDLQHTLEEVASTGFLEELSDAREAERLGVVLALGHAANMMPPDDQRRVLAAIVRAARRHGLDPLLLASVIQIESRFNPYAISSAGARGLMQLMPDTASWLLDRELKPDALYNGPMNIELGSAYLRQLMERFDGDLMQALLAYNAGPGVARSLVRNSKSWKRLQVYPQAVLAEYRRLTQLREDAGGQLIMRAEFREFVTAATRRLASWPSASS